LQTGVAIGGNSSGSIFDEERRRMQSGTRPVAVQRFSLEELRSQGYGRQPESTPAPETTPTAPSQPRFPALQQVANTIEGFYDTAGLGLQRAAQDRINRLLVNIGAMSPEEAQQIERDREARTQTTSYKVGQFAGYIPPGAAIERGVTAAARPLIQNLPRAGRLATTGAAAGAIEAAVQEGADVAFRGQTFDPENVAIGGAAGAALGAATPLIERGIRAAGQRLRGLSRSTETPVQPQRQVAMERPSQPVREAENAVQTVQRIPDDVPQDVFPETTPAASVRQGWFERLFGTNPLGITPRLRSQGRNPLTTEGQIVDQPIKRTVRGALGTARAAARNFYQNFVDMNSPIKNISRNAYEASIDANRANQLANVIVTDKFVTPQGEIVGEGLQNIIRKAGRGNYNAFTDYLIARHALTRMSRGEEVYAKHLNMTPEKVAERIQILESRYPGFREIAKEWDNYFRNIRQRYGVEEGLISQSLADLLERKNPTYAPMRRQFTDEEKIKLRNPFASRPLFSGQRAPLQEVSPVGSRRKIVDPVRSTIEQTGAWVQAAMRNRVMREIVNKIMADPQGMSNIAEIVQRPKGQPNLREVLEKEGEEGFLENLNEDFNQLFRKQRLDQDNIVRAMIQGEPVYIKVKDPEAVKALLGMGDENASIALNFMTTLSNLIKQGATGALAPLFAVRGATMDVGQALIQSENPLQHAGYLFGAIISSIVDATPGLRNLPGVRNLRSMAQDFYRTGGGYSAALRGERGLRRGVSNMRQEPILSARGIARGIGMAIASPYRFSLKLADIAENMNRIAAFNYKLRQLGGQRTPENIREAMNYAREITVNYSRKGRASRGLEAVFPYQNAAVQGMYRFAKSWIKNPVKTAAMVGVGVLAPKFIEYMRFHNDEDYQNLPAREKYRNLFVWKNQDGTFVKIPMPPEYGALGAFMVDMLEAYRDGDPEAFKGASDAIVNAYTPPPVSGVFQGVTQGGGIDQSLAGVANATSLSPLAAIYGNRSFTGAPIESMKVSDRSPQYRYDERTSSIARWLGEQLNYSPMKIDYIIRAYGGDPARIILPLTSDVGRGTTRNTLLRTWITDPVFTNTLTDDFYRGKELLTQAYKDSQEVGAELPSWYNDNLRKMLTSTAKGSVTKRLSALSEEKRQINANNSLTAEQKAKRLRDIQRQINEIYIDVNSRMREAGVPLLSR